MPRDKVVCEVKRAVCVTCSRCLQQGFGETEEEAFQDLRKECLFDPDENWYVPTDKETK
jgi:hypothetical protein